MARRRIHDDELHAQFVTFSCYRRRRLLDDEQARQVVMGILAEELVKSKGVCSDFVMMPNHVHAIVWFPKVGCLSPFMQNWKSRTSRQLKKSIRARMPHYAKTFQPKGPRLATEVLSFQPVQ